MNQTQKKLILRALANGGQAMADPKRAREMKALRDLIDTRAITAQEGNAYTMTEHGHAIVEYLTKNDLLKA